MSITLKTESDTVEKLDDLNDKINTINPQYYWFEPDITACIGKTLPLETLKKCNNNNWQNKPFSELMLFGETTGMTLIKQDDDKYRYFYWQEDGNTDNTSDTLDCIKQTRNAYLRDFSQFDLNDKYDDLLEALQITEYLHQNQRIAWTIYEKSGEDKS